ncbi:MAG: lytic transglycosylase domain-containing protein [Candidatus Handelsmanbacteria bacterium]|nr:lytic transglycosylase domain-containing protein [Candidatus Handelsmanbacteria bacterium]
MNWRLILNAGRGGLLCGLLLFQGHRARAEEIDPLAAILERSYGRRAATQIIGRSIPSPTAPRPALRPAPPPAALPLAGDLFTRVRRYDRLIEHHSKLHALDADLVRAVIYAESGGNPRAVSRAGAAGLMQLMPATASELGVADRFDPEQNIASGTRYLRSLMDRFHSTEVALWAYNAGPEAVEQGRMPRETRQYVPHVLRLRQNLKRLTPAPEN